MRLLEGHAADLRPAEIAEYLTATGWEQDRAGGATTHWRKVVDDKARSVALLPEPADADYEDYVAALLTRLEDVEGRPREAIARDISTKAQQSALSTTDAPTASEHEAWRDLVASARAEIPARVALQHQLLVVAGALATAGAAVLAGVDGSAGLAYGLCLLMVSLAYAMQNHEHLIVTLSEALLTGGGTDGGEGAQVQVERRWERAINRTRSQRRYLPHACSTYAVPIFAAVGFGIAFATRSDDDWVLALPAGLLAYFLGCAFAISRRYDRLGLGESAEPFHRLDE